jgi:hypothetical protein
MERKGVRGDGRYEALPKMLPFFVLSPSLGAGRGGDKEGDAEEMVMEMEMGMCMWVWVCMWLVLGGLRSRGMTWC